MLTNKEKAAAIYDFYGLNSEHSGAKILTLLNILIEELRIDNDTADDAHFKLNQGEIKGYIQLKDYLKRGIPAGEKK